MKCLLCTTSVFKESRNHQYQCPVHTWFDRLMALCHCGCLHGGETQVHIIQRHILGRHVSIGFLLSCSFRFVCKAVRQSPERNTWGSRLILLHLCILAKSKQCHHLHLCKFPTYNYHMIKHPPCQELWLAFPPYKTSLLDLQVLAGTFTFPFLCVVCSYGNYFHICTFPSRFTSQLCLWTQAQWQLVLTTIIIPVSRNVAWW